MIIDKRVCYIHIPRTGGKYVRDTLILNNYLVEIHRYNFFHRGKELPHLTYPEYDEYLNFMSLQKFTVVRDPVDRFLSMCRETHNLNENKIKKILDNQEYFDEAISHFRLNNLGNWFIPQVNFLNYQTKIWKFEDGFGDEFKKWLKNNFNINVNIYPNKKELGNNNTPNYIESLTDKQISFIKNYYYQDYKILEY